MFGFIGNIVRTASSLLGRVVARQLAHVADQTVEGVVIHAEERFGVGAAELAQEVAYSYAETLTSQVLSGNIWFKAMSAAGFLTSHPVVKGVILMFLGFINDLDTQIRQNLRSFAVDAEWRRRNFRLYTEGDTM
jgi:hypothetical protein